MGAQCGLAILRGNKQMRSPLETCGGGTEACDRGATRMAMRVAIGTREKEKLHKKKKERSEG